MSREIENLDHLLHLGMLARDPKSEEPLYGMTVVRAIERKTESNVAEAEEILDEAEEYCASPEIPIKTKVVVEKNLVAGILRGIGESRIDAVLMYRNATREGLLWFGEYIFGHDIDQLLSQSGKMVIITSMKEPVESITRFVVVVPSHVASNHGFYAELQVLNRMSEQIDAPIRFLVVGETPHNYETVIDKVRLEVQYEIEGMFNWDHLRSHIKKETREGDLVSTLSPREGGRGWDGELKTLPLYRVKVVVGNVITVYLRQRELEETGLARLREVQSV